MKSLSFPRIAVYASIYFVVGAGLSTAFTFSHLRGGGDIDMSYAHYSFIMSFVATLLLSTIFGYLQVLRPIAHAAIAHLISDIAALLAIAVLVGSAYGYSQAAVESAMAIPVVILGAFIGAALRRVITSRRPITSQSGS